MDGSISHAPTEEFFQQLEKELPLPSRQRTFNLPLVIWPMMVHYLDRKATLSTAVQQVVQMRPSVSLSDQRGCGKAQ